MCSNPKKVVVASANRATGSHYKVRVSFSKDEEHTYKIAIPKTFQLSSAIINYFESFFVWSGAGDINETTDVDSLVLSSYGGNLMKWYMKGTFSFLL